MSALPEQYRRYAQPEQRPLHGPVELYREADPIVHVPDPYNPNASIAVRRSALVPATPTPPRDLTPQPLLDPLAQRLIAGGVGVGAAGAGVGFGVGQLFAGVAMMGTSGLAILLGLLLAAGGLRRSTVTVHQTVHQHAGWFGKNDTTM
jgi:hypothetical protein